MSAHSTSCEKYADINVNTFGLVLANVLTCPDADIYADTSFGRVSKSVDPIIVAHYQGHKPIHWKTRRAGNDNVYTGLT